MAALGVMTALFDGSKQFLMVAEDRLLIICLDICNSLAARQPLFSIILSQSIYLSVYLSVYAYFLFHVCL